MMQMPYKMLLGGLRTTTHPSVHPSVSCLCHLLTMPTHHCANELLNWWWPTAAKATQLMPWLLQVATAISQQQACCGSLYTLSGRASIISAIN